MTPNKGCDAGMTCAAALAVCALTSSRPAARPLRAGDLLGRQMHLQRAGGIVEVAGFGRADDGRRHPLGPLPGQGDLGHLAALALGQLVDAGDDLHILRLGAVVLAHGHPVGSGAQAVARPGGTGQVTGGQRAVRHQRNAHLTADGDQFPLVLAVEQVIVVLHDREGGPAVVPGGELHIVELVAVHGRRAQRPHLAGFHQVVQGLHRLLDGGVVVEAVDDVEVEVVGAEAAQGAVDLPHNGRPGQPPGVEVDLGGDDHLVPGYVLFQGAAEVFLAGARRVAVGGVEEVDAEVEGVTDDLFALGLVRGALLSVCFLLLL